MLTAVSETSREAFHSHSPLTLQRKEQDVLRVFEGVPSLELTREQLADRLGWKEASVCGRVNSLVTKKALVEVAGGKTRSGRMAKLLRLPEGSGKS